MRKLVLVADDEPGIRRMLVRLFEHAGYFVVVTEDGAEALREALICKPDAIVSDGRMPRLDGRGLLDALPVDLRVKVVFFTGTPGVVGDVPNTVVGKTDLRGLVDAVKRVLDAGAIISVGQGGPPCDSQGG